MYAIKAIGYSFTENIDLYWTVHISPSINFLGFLFCEKLSSMQAKQ